MTGGSRGRLAIALDAGDALDRVARLLRGEDVDGMDDRVLPSPAADGTKTIDVKLRHRADVHAWLVPGAAGDPPVHVALTSDEDVGLFALAGPAGSADGAGPPSTASLDADLDAPGPILVKVEPVGTRPVKVHLTSTVGLTPFDEPDDGRAITVDHPWMGAADYAGDIDWYTLTMAADEAVTIRRRHRPSIRRLRRPGRRDGPAAGQRPRCRRAARWRRRARVPGTQGRRVPRRRPDVRFGGAGAYRLTVDLR